MTFENTSVPKRKNCWKRILYLKENTLGKKLLYLRENTFEKTSVPKRKKIEKEKSSKWSNNTLNKTSVPKRKKGKKCWKRLLYLKEKTVEEKLLYCQN